MSNEETATGRALMALAASINYGEQAHRALPEIPAALGHPSHRIKTDVQFHLSQAGRSLGNAYDALRVLSDIINRA